MSPKFREWFFETAKFASAVITYWLLSLIPVELGFPGGKLLEGALEIVIASSVAFLLWGFVLGRPTVELRWRLEDDQVEPNSGRPTIRSDQAVNLEIHVIGESWVRRAIHCYTRQNGFQLELDFKPVGSHLVTVQRGRIETLRENPTQTGLIFYGIRADPGIHAALAVRIRREDDLTGGYPIDLKISQRWSPDIGFSWPKLFKVNPGIEGFNLRGR